mmetsp:Transcript_58776/g.140089  ORF Transcript_58776/g.140089 Transcript_58776/m.140089 type:complete len:611 (-) Transcript_58776:187-2019(-)
MIYYDSSGNHFRTVLRINGSVCPQALAFALPCGLLGAALCTSKYYTDFIQDIFPGEAHQVGSFIAFNSILGFLIVFRTQNAYSRYWEGTTLLQKVRGVWFNTASHLFAFFAAKEEKAAEVRRCQFLIVKMMSLLYCTSLQSLAMTENTNFEVIDTEGLDERQLEYMTLSHDPPSVVMHWIQRLVIKSMREGLLDVPPAVLSRVFQELSSGVEALADASKISDTPFPFAFAQMISVMLLIQFFLAPIICSALTDSIVLAASGSFLAVFLSCSMNLIASEIELPFGDDANDLPLGEMQQAMNASLLTLMHWRTQQVPVLPTKTPFLRLALYEDCMVFNREEHDDSEPLQGVRRLVTMPEDHQVLSQTKSAMAAGVSVSSRSTSGRALKTDSGGSDLVSAQSGNLPAVAGVQSYASAQASTRAGTYKYGRRHSWQVQTGSAGHGRQTKYEHMKAKIQAKSGWAGASEHPILQLNNEVSLSGEEFSSKESKENPDYDTERSTPGKPAVTFRQHSAGKDSPSDTAVGNGEKSIQILQPSDPGPSRMASPGDFPRPGRLPSTSVIQEEEEAAELSSSALGPPATVRLDLGSSQSMATNAFTPAHPAIDLPGGSQRV